MPRSDDNKSGMLNVVDFDPCGSSGVLLQLRQYWESMRSGKSVPLRSDVSPQGIQRVVEHAFLVERLAPGTARFRLAGRHLVDLMGMEVRGMSLNALVNQPSRRRFCAVLETVFAAPQIAEMRFSAKADYGCPEVSARMLLLPLKSDLGDVTRALGCLVSRGGKGLRPRRLDLISEFLSPIIVGGRIMAPNLPPAIQSAEKATTTEKAGGLFGKSMRRETAKPTTPEAATTPQQRRAMFHIVTNDGSRRDFDPNYI